MSGIDAGTVYAAVRLKMNELDNDVRNAAAKFEKLDVSAKKMADGFNKVGKTMSIGVTAPIVAASAAMIKFSSDEGEALNATNVVFKESSKVITDWGDNAAKQAGLSRAEFYQSSAVMGSMLKGMNLSLEDSASATIELTKRSADLASIFNTDVKDATGAVAAFIRGEAEPIRRYGVSINEAGIKAKAMAMGLYSGTGELSNYAKAQARIAVIMEQTADIAGDFVNTSDQLANSTRVLQAEVKNQAAAMGKDLLPIVLDVVKGLRSITEKIGELDPEQRKLILTLAALAAGFGPVAMGIGNTIKAVNQLGTAMTFLSANPIALTVAALGAVYLGLKAIGAENNKRMLEEVSEQFGDMANEANLSAQKISDVQEAIARSSRGNASFADLQAQTQQIAQDLGISVEQVARIGLKSEKVTAETKSQLTALMELNKQERIRLSYIPGTVEYQERMRKAAEAVADATKATNDESAKTDKQAEARLKAFEEYEKAVKEANDREARGLLSKAEAEDAINAARERELQTLYDIGYLDESASTKGRQRMDELTESIVAHNEERERQAELMSQYQQKIEDVGELEDERREIQAERLIEDIENSELELEQKDELIARLEAIRDTTKEMGKMAQIWNGAISEGIKSGLSGFQSLGEAIADSSLSWGVFAKLGLQAIGSMLVALGSELAVQAAKNWAAYIESRGSDVAAAAAAVKYTAASALSYSGAGIVNGMAENFASGGIVEPRGSGTGTLVNVAENDEGEVLFNTSETGMKWTDQAAEAIAKRLVIHNHLIVDGRELSEWVVPAVNKGLVRIKR
jgi:hypothetical protein